MHILISGASGLVGTKLTQLLTMNGDKISQLSRNSTVNENQFSWNPVTEVVDPKCFRTTDAIIHLAGENIASKRWSASFKQAILQSRIQGTRTLCSAILKLPEHERPKIFVSASATGYYGNTFDACVDETSPKGTGFLSDVCETWENETNELHQIGIRVVKIRLGVVLSAQGGALSKMLPIFRAGLGGPLANGQAWFSSIHIDDVVSAIQFVLNNNHIEGAVNLVSPDPIRNEEWTNDLSKILHRPAFFRVPKHALHLAFGKEMADELFLASSKVNPLVLHKNNFQWKFPTTLGALTNLLSPNTFHL